MTDPFGITDDMRTRGQEQAAIDEIRAAFRQLLADIRTNLAALDALPDGTQIICPHCRILHPIEAFR